MHLKDALITYYEITTLSKPLLEKIAKLSENDGLKELINNGEKLKSYLDGRDLLDLVREFGPWGALSTRVCLVTQKNTSTFIFDCEQPNG